MGVILYAWACSYHEVIIFSTLWIITVFILAIVGHLWKMRKFVPCKNFLLCSMILPIHYCLFMSSSLFWSWISPQRSQISWLPAIAYMSCLNTNLLIGFEITTVCKVELLAVCWPASYYSSCHGNWVNLFWSGPTGFEAGGQLQSWWGFKLGCRIVAVASWVIQL